MRVHHLTAFHQGGAGIAARRLHSLILKAEIDSQLFIDDLMTKDVIEDGALPSATSKWDSQATWIDLARAAFRYPQQKLRRRRYLRGRSGYFSQPWRIVPKRPSHLLSECDLLHLHWVARLIDGDRFFDYLPAELPVVWTLHDMNPLTGGCHHADACQNYRTGCGHCPMLNRPNSDDLSRKIFIAKMQLFKRRCIHIVTPSYWMESIARESPIAREFASIRTIYNGIDLELFQRSHGKRLRDALGIDSDAVVLGYGAESLTNQRKGISEFFKLLKHLSHMRNVVGLVFGRGPVPMEQGVRVYQLGSLNTASELSEAYSAMDVFVSPTHAEILGQAILESQACETPVVAFGVGGVHESVADGETGILASLHNFEDLLHKTLLIIDGPDLRQRMGRAGRRRVERLFDAKHSITRHLQLYKECLSTALHKSSHSVENARPDAQPFRGSIGCKRL
jgi:glycosyltransferase involved in cell wall biosynthesis